MDEINTPIEVAIDKLRDNISNVARVYEWAELMGYRNPNNFGAKFLRYHNTRPAKVLIYHRLNSIVNQLRNQIDKSNFEIAREHGMPDEKALNNFTNYHLDCSPSHIKLMSDEQITDTFKNSGVNLGNVNNS